MLSLWRHLRPQKEIEMYHTNTRGQQVKDRLYDASGSITTGGTSQLILPERVSTTHLFLQNISDTDMYFQFGSATAKCAITSGAVSSVTVLNGGFGFTIP